MSSFGYGGRSRLRKFCHACFSAIVNGEVFTMNATEAATFMARLEAGQSLRMLETLRVGQLEVSYQRSRPVVAAWLPARPLKQPRACMLFE